MTGKLIWKEVSEKDYDYGLNCLPPAIMNGLGFLVGEPYSHKLENGRYAATFRAFAEDRGAKKFYRCETPLTRNEFRALTLAAVLDNVVA